MMVPSGALAATTRRTARLTGQGGSTARRTAGLELALHDNSPMQLGALDIDDPRVVTVKVAHPPALVVAKLIKLSERMSDPKPDRILAKDSSDILRILRYTDAAAVGSSLREFALAGLGAGTIETAVDFLRSGLSLRTSPMVQLAVNYHQQYETPAQITTSFRTLAQRLLDTYDS